MPWKTDEEIKTELQALRLAKRSVRQYTAFGDDNHAAIEAQCSVLSERMMMDEVYDNWGDVDADEFGQNVLDAAVEASDWMAGKLAAGHVSPSDGWACAGFAGVAKS